VGIPIPLAKLDVNGSFKTQSADVSGVLSANSVNIAGSLSAQSASITNSFSVNALSAQSANITGTTYLQGNVGIGIAPTQEKLEVNGSFKAQPDYQLRPLDELEQYIKQNHRLPEIPSAEEVRENGIDLGDMQGKLLMKIEELTLYTIEQQKFIENLQKRLLEIENKKGGE